MAHDLIFGKTGRDWSCGISASPDSPGEIRSKEQTVALADATRTEISNNVKACRQLMRDRKIPEQHRLAFSKFNKRWGEYPMSIKLDPQISDALALYTFRKQNQRFTSLFAALASTPGPGPKISDAELAIETKTETRTEDKKDDQDGSTVLKLLGAGLLIAGIGFAISKDTPRRYS